MQISTARAKSEKQFVFPSRADVVPFFKSLLAPNMRMGVLYKWLSQGPGCHFDLYGTRCNQSIKSSTTQAPEVSAHPPSPFAGSSCKVAASPPMSHTHAPHINSTPSCTQRKLSAPTAPSTQGCSHLVFLNFQSTERRDQSNPINSHLLSSHLPRSNISSCSVPFPLPFSWIQNR